MRKSIFAIAALMVWSLPAQAEGVLGWLEEHAASSGSLSDKQEVQADAAALLGRIVWGGIPARIISPTCLRVATSSGSIVGLISGTAEMSGPKRSRMRHTVVSCVFMPWSFHGWRIEGTASYSLRNLPISANTLRLSGSKSPCLSGPTLSRKFEFLPLAVSNSSMTSGAFLGRAPSCQNHFGSKHQQVSPGAVLLSGKCPNSLTAMSP